MSEDRTTQPVEDELDETAVSRAELQIAREKIQIERERLVLERERLAAERERWTSDAALKSRAEGRNISVGTLILIGIICVLAGVIAGGMSAGLRGSPATALGIEALIAPNTTNATGRGDQSIILHPMDTSGGKKAYLLILN